MCLAYQSDIQNLKALGAKVSNTALGMKPKQLYLVIDADSNEEATMLNRVFNNSSRKDSYDDKNRKKYGVISRDELIESGFNSADESCSVEEIVAYDILVDKLHKILRELTEEKKRIAMMIAYDESVIEVAEELGIKRTTLNSRRNALLAELYLKLKDYR